MIDDFGLFWNAYPRKTSVVSARAAWGVAAGKVAPQVIIEAAKRYAEDPNRDPTYTPSPANWLEQERWHDDPLPPRKLTQEEIIERDKRKAEERAKFQKQLDAEWDRQYQESIANAVPMPDYFRELILEMKRKRP